LRRYTLESTFVNFFLVLFCVAATRAAAWLYVKKVLMVGGAGAQYQTRVESTPDFTA